MQSRPALHAHRSAFTLVELLVVIAIVAALAALSSGIFLKMQNRAKSVASANILRQWGQALVLYSTDQMGAIPYEGDRDNFTWTNIANTANVNSWFNVLPPYLGQKGMRDLSTAERNTYNRDSGIHSCPLVKWTQSTNPSFAFMMNSQIYHPDGPSNLSTNPVRMVHITVPSATVIFADLDQATKTRARGRGRHVDNRQPGKKCNIVFMDGSMKSFDADYVRQDTFSSGGITYTENNKPDLIWNPWNHPRSLR